MKNARQKKILELIKKFHIGVAPKSYSTLYDELRKDFSNEVLEKAGLILKSEKGGYIDRFRYRVIIPIQNENGEFIYSFNQDETGEKLYEEVQNAIDKAKADGADYIIAISHLGYTMDCSPWTSIEVVENTVGIDVIMDGHSHSEVPCERIKDEAGNWVLVSQTEILVSLQKPQISLILTWDFEIVRQVDIGSIPILGIPVCTNVGKVLGSEGHVELRNRRVSRKQYARTAPKSGVR